MAAADKARFHLEQHAATLNAWSRARLFTTTEIHAITAKRSSFEHTLAARGSKPTDYARYAEYEINLHTLLHKRCARLGVKRGRGTGKGKGEGGVGEAQRAVFYILDRGTRKFPGDLGLWVQYIRFCQKEQAGRKLAKVFTSALRLRPMEYGLWVLAAKWYAEQQGDMRTARGYMQRGLRFCKEQRELWLEYAKLEMVYLAKIAARRKILGVDEARKEVVTEEEDENMITLPTITAAEIDPDSEKQDLDAPTLERIANAPAFTGAIPMAIFDAAMTQFHGSFDVAESFFALVATFETVPTAAKVLQHIADHLRSIAPDSVEALFCEVRLHLFGVETTGPAFPAALGKALSKFQQGLAAGEARQNSALAGKAVRLLLPFLAHADDMDEDVVSVLVASVNRYLRFASPGAKDEMVVPLLREAANSGGPLSLEQLVTATQEQGIPPFSPTQRGRWFRARGPTPLESPDALAAVGASEGEQWSMVSLPANLARQKSRIMHTELSSDTERTSGEISGLDDPDPDPKRPCPLLELPEELILRILRFIVPSAGTFHVVSPSAKVAAGSGVRITVINHLASHLEPKSDSAADEAEDSVPVCPKRTALARTSRRMHSLHNSILYGENQFHFTLRATAPKERGVWPPMIALPPESAGLGLSVWSQRYELEGTPDAEVACWPLTCGTAPFVRDLSLLVLIREDQKDSVEVLRKSIEGVLKPFRMARVTLRRMSVTGVPREAVSVVGREWLLCCVGSGGRVTLDTWVRDQYGEKSGDVGELWEPVRRLRGLSDVRMSGLIVEEDAKAVIREMTGSQQRGEVVDVV
ncbi:U3 snoRNP protein [Teratosphaeriaceae sp. CCFEE 6253]|nr:U3 snoRNP protein [Teratosphaeriaceae sp. CCFEE 6253]